MVINLLVLASLISGLYPYSVALGGVVHKSANESVSATVQPAADEVRDVRNVWVTAYSSVPEETDETPFIAASGKPVSPGILAANFLDFGTRVKIPEVFGDQVFVVEDRMARRKTDVVDIWMPTKRDAVKFGIKRAQIVILN